MPVIGATYSLNANEIFSVLFNMIIRETTVSNNISETNSVLVDQARIDGGLYGDSVNRWSTDVLKSAPWGNDAEATNLLALHRPPAPKGQRIVLDVFRQISLTVDDYLSKRPWMSSDSFGQFTSVILGWINTTKRVYDASTYNAFIGTCYSAATKNTKTVDLTSASSGDPLYGLTGKEKEQMEAMYIARDVADLLDDLTDYTRDYNDYKFLRSYSREGLKVVWNKKWINKIRKVDLPATYHIDFMDKFNEYSLNERFFGTKITATNIGTYSASTAAPGKPLQGTGSPYTYKPGTNNANGFVRTLVEADYTVGGTTYHLFAGDELPADASVTTAELGTIYIQDNDVICKVISTLPPYMSSFEVATSFFNPKSLTENHYLTYGHNTLEHYLDSAFITVKASL